MTLTPAQLQILHDHIVNTPSLQALPNTPDGNDAIARLLNQLAVPAFVVWRTDLTAAEVLGVIVWTEFIGRSAGERDAFNTMLQLPLISAAAPNIRSGFTDIFSGAQGATTRAQLLAVSKRSARDAERLLAAGTGSDASPATLTFEGLLMYQDVEEARRLA